MLFSLGKLLQSLRDKQEQEESTKPFLAAVSQVSWRNAALADDAPEKGGEDPGCSPHPYPVPSSPRLRPCSPAGCSTQGGCSWVLGKHCPLGPVVFSPVALLTSLPGIALITGQQGPATGKPHWQPVAGAAVTLGSVFLAGTEHLGSGYNVCC